MPVILALSASLLASPAVAEDGTPDSGASTYENPLEPRVPDDGTVDSCADPTVLRGQQADDPYWYMWCTTDPLNDDDLNEAGELVFRRIPQMRSLDLVNWDYLGEAFRDASLPDWADPTTALWAPDIVYSETFDQYYMFVGVTNTAPSVGNPDAACAADNAIGVAVSDTPTGPWTFSDEPVVAPRLAGTIGEDGVIPCEYFWTYDPDVLGDAIEDTSVLYYGSYFGGVFGVDLTLTETGAVTGETATQVAIANRYEGTNVVFRNGFYYMFVSATNCCNGALTGYSVFVGRSEDPLGPFVDREGNSFLAGRVGGTPVLSMNGNRWVGTGHNTVFQDASGQWWTIYHAVDQRDPFFETAPGFTKRPALLDPIDWVNGWPTVRGGLWASDEPMPAPAAQPGDPSRYERTLAGRDRVKKWLPAFSDSFSELDDEWTWVREPDPATYTVEGGALNWQVQEADLFVDSNTASVLRREAPRRDYIVETRVRLDVPPEGCCYNFVQAGLVIYGDDDNYIKLTSASIFETRQTEFAKELSPVPEGWNRYGNTVVGPPADWTYLRIAVARLNGEERKEAGGDTERYTAYTSQDGKTWVRGGTWTHSLGRADIGLVSMGGPGGFTAEIDYVRVFSSRLTAPLN